MTKEQKIIRAKVGLLELAKQLGNVSQACKMLGYSRDSFYRFTCASGGRPTERSTSAIRLPSTRISAGPVRASERPSNRCRTPE